MCLLMIMQKKKLQDDINGLRFEGYRFENPTTARNILNFAFWFIIFMYMLTVSLVAHHEQDFFTSGLKTC